MSVVEGEVKVDQRRRLGSAASGRSEDHQPEHGARLRLRDDVAWSANAAKYLALLGELSEIGKRIEQIPGPGVRYESKLARLLPENTMVFASIPNLESTLTEAIGIFEERVQRARFCASGGAKNKRSNCRRSSTRCGPSAITWATRSCWRFPSGEQAPLLIAEVRSPGLRDFLASSSRD